MSALLKIDKAEPAPIAMARGIVFRTAEALKVGESFLLPGNLSLSYRVTLAHKLGVRYAPKKFKAAQYGDTLRLWRVK